MDTLLRREDRYRRNAANSTLATIVAALEMADPEAVKAFADATLTALAVSQEASP